MFFFVFAFFLMLTVLDSCVTYFSQKQFPGARMWCDCRVLYTTGPQGD